MNAQFFARIIMVLGVFSKLAFGEMRSSKDEREGVINNNCVLFIQLRYII